MLNQVLLGLGLTLASQAETFNFNPNWRFIREDVAGAQASGFDDSQWIAVSAPHTYNDVDTFDDFHELGHVGERKQWGGKTWYRKTFTAPVAWANQRIVIEFEAIRQIAEVYLNGKHVGKGENGFVPFAVDLTEGLKIGEENVLAIQVNNEFIKDEPGHHKWDKYEGGARFPWNNPHWHPAHGGIYRNVKLHILPPVHLTLPLFSNLGTVGTYTYAVDASRDQATIGVEPQISNGGSENLNLTVTSRVIDMEGREVLKLEEPLLLKAGETKTPVLRGKLNEPKLWEPKHPYVYTVVTEVYAGKKLLDRGEEPLGVRWMKWNPYTGAYINDRYIKFEGWGHKPTDEWPGMGAAQPDWLRHYTLDFVTKAGGNYIRWGHCAGGPAQIRASDRLGIMTSQVGVDGEEDFQGYAWDVRAEAFRDTIIYFRNNPSIVIWEGGNRKVSRDHVEQLTGYINKYDPYGGRGYGHRSPDAVVGEYSSVSVTMEGNGYSENMCPIEGEYNREESPRRVWDRQTPGFEDWHATGSYDLTAEQFALNQCWQYDKISMRHHGGGANWIFTDSTSGGRVSTETSRTSGELDAVRLPKEAYWVTKVIFSDEPDLHLLGHWNYPECTMKTQYVVADCDEVELFVNGKSLGRKERKPGTDVKNNKHRLIFSWTDVTWQAGMVEGIGYVDGKEVARMQKETHGPAVALRMTPITGPKGLLATGSDVALIDVEAVDAEGRRCLTWYGKVDFTTMGPAKWLGGMNSGKEITIHKPFLDLESGINRVAVRSALQPGKIVVTAQAEGLPQACLAIESMDAGIENGIAAALPPEPKATIPTSLPLPDPQDLVDAAVTEPIVEKMDQSELITDLVYTGQKPEGIDIVKPKIGQPWYTGYPNESRLIHPLVVDGEQIRVPFSDWDFWAADVIGFTAKKPIWVYIAHNTKIPDPGWLKKEYERVPGALYNVNVREQYQLYRRAVAVGDEVTIGAAVDEKSQAQGCWFKMYMVYVVDQSIEADFEIDTTPRFNVKNTAAGNAEDGQWPVNAVDLDKNSRWVNKGDKGSAWIEIELVEPMELSGLKVSLFKSSRRTYPIEVRVDGELVFNGESVKRSGFQKIEFGKKVRGKHIRLTMPAKNSNNNWYFSIHDLLPIMD
jgi:beta-galactosidase